MAGAGAGAGAGANDPEGGAAALLSRVRHWARNCGQVSPPVVPAAWACFHWLAHTAITLSALAGVEPAHANPKAIAAAVGKGTSEWRIDIPTNPKPGTGSAISLSRPGAFRQAASTF